MNRFQYIAYVQDRLKEPSTHAGIGVIALYVVPGIEDTAVEGIIEVITLVFISLAIFLPEFKPQEKLEDKKPEDKTEEVKNETNSDTV